MEAINDLILVFLGVIVAFLMGGLKKVSALVSGLPGTMKAVVVMAIGIGVTFVGSALGVALPGDITTWDATTVQGIVVAIVGMGAHALKGAVTPGD